MVLKSLLQNFPAIWTMPRLNKQLLNTGHFTFWDDLTKANVTIVCVRRFN